MHNPTQLFIGNILSFETVLTEDLYKNKLLLVRFFPKMDTRYNILKH